jgi:hypothetical protein
MSDFTWIVLFAAGSYLLVIIFGILKSAIDCSIRKIRHKDQKIHSSTANQKTRLGKEEGLNTEDSEGDGLILFDDDLFSPELFNAQEEE